MGVSSSRLKSGEREEGRKKLVPITNRCSDVHARVRPVANCKYHYRAPFLFPLSRGGYLRWKRSSLKKETVNGLVISKSQTRWIEATLNSCTRLERITTSLSLSLSAFSSSNYRGQAPTYSRPMVNNSK